MKFFIILSTLVLGLMNTCLTAENSLQTEKAFLETALKRTQIETNNIVIDAAKEFFSGLTKNSRYPGQKENIETPSEYWHVTRKILTFWESGSKKETEIPILCLKNEHIHQINEALDDLLKRDNILECTTAMMVFKVFALRALIGRVGFKSQAKALYRVLENHSDLSPNDLISCLPEQFLTSFEGVPPSGSIGYVPNLPQYREFKPRGNSTGFNVVFFPDQSCISYGDPFKNGSVICSSVVNFLKNEFFKIDDVELKVNEHTKKCEILGKNDLFEKLQLLEQKKHEYMYFDINKINELILRLLGRKK